MIEVEADLWSFGVDACDARCITTNGTIKRDGRGVMGRGCALQARERWPRLDRALGNLLRLNGNHTQVLHATSGQPALIAFPVKHEWHEPADLQLIAQSARELVVLVETFQWRQIVLPRPGCGNGGLTWSQVRPVIAPILDTRFQIVTL